MKRRALVTLLALVASLAASATVTAGRRSRGRGSNMPEGWSWPPSPTMVAAGQRCLERLDAAGIAWRAAPRSRAVATPIELVTMELGGVRLVPTYRKGPFVMDCHLALALDGFAEVLRQLGVSELRFSTIHEYRRVRLHGRHMRALSRHALGLAIDVFEVTTDSGARLVVKNDYRKHDQTLLAIERGVNASLDFRRPLTPGNSSSHRDHFHLEARVDFRPDRTRTASLW